MFQPSLQLYASVCLYFVLYFFTPPPQCSFTSQFRMVLSVVQILCCEIDFDLSLLAVTPLLITKKNDCVTLSGHVNFVRR